MIVLLGRQHIPRPSHTGLACIVPSHPPPYWLISDPQILVLPLISDSPVRANFPDKGIDEKNGELTLENDFLYGALGKAGLLSAKR